MQALSNRWNTVILAVVWSNIILKLSLVKRIKHTVVRNMSMVVKQSWSLCAIRVCATSVWMCYVHKGLRSGPQYARFTAVYYYYIVQYTLYINYYLKAFRHAINSSILPGGKIKQKTSTHILKKDSKLLQIDPWSSFSNRSMQLRMNGFSSSHWYVCCFLH